MLPGNKTMTIVYWGTQFIPVFCEDVSLKDFFNYKGKYPEAVYYFITFRIFRNIFWQKEIQELLNVIYKWEKNF